MPRMRLILNPQSDRGDTRARKDTLQQIVERHAQAAAGQAEPYELEWAVTQKHRHATQLAREAGEQGYDVVVAIGGDGTVHEVVNGLMQIEASRRPRLGVIPVGTGNDFAFNVGLPADPEQAAAHLFSGKTRTVDAGLIANGNGRQEYWDNTVGFGFAGAVNVIASTKRNLRGFLLYFVSVIECILFKPQDLNIVATIDDQRTVERYVSMVNICNGPREGGGFPVLPTAAMDDGLISFLLMRRANRVQMFYFVPVVMAAKHLGYKNFFEPGTARRLRFKSDKPLAIHTDGEQFAHWDDGLYEFEVEIIPGALQVLCNN